jgi:hypothetical protein
VAAPVALDDLVADNGDGVEHSVGDELSEQRTAGDAARHERTGVHAQRAHEQGIENLRRPELGEQRPDGAPRPPTGTERRLAAPLGDRHDSVEPEVFRNRSGDGRHRTVADDMKSEIGASDRTRGARDLGRQVPGGPLADLAHTALSTRDGVRQPALFSLAREGCRMPRRGIEQLQAVVRRAAGKLSRAV